MLQLRVSHHVRKKCARKIVSYITLFHELEAGFRKISSQEETDGGSKRLHSNSPSGFTVFENKDTYHVSTVWTSSTTKTSPLCKPPNCKHLFHLSRSHCSALPYTTLNFTSDIPWSFSSNSLIAATVTQQFDFVKLETCCSLMSPED